MNTPYLVSLEVSDPERFALTTRLQAFCAEGADRDARALLDSLAPLNAPCGSGRTLNLSAGALRRLTVLLETWQAPALRRLTGRCNEYLTAPVPVEAMA